MEYLINLFKKDFMKRIVVFVVLGIIIWFLKPVINMLLLTFIFIYISNTIENFIINKTSKYIKIKDQILTLVLYILMFFFLAFLIYRYIPLLVSQSIEMLSKVSNIKINIDRTDDPLLNHMQRVIGQIDIKGYTKDSLNTLLTFATHVGKGSINVFMAFMLSMFFMLEKRKIKIFADKFKESKISGMWVYVREFGNSFLNSFGKVMQAQILIAFVNSILSIIILWFMGFPQLVALWAMIFVLSLIPVAGVIISLIPLSLIGYQIGGVRDIVWVIGLVIVLHGFESYVLNPKFMSDKTELPIFLTFIVLIVSEQLLGVWGLLIGIPLFIFILDFLGVKFTSSDFKKKVNKEKDEES
ncbi:Predicted PurR-regulated permease PerM [Clostridium cavendishii DSM 21758]|uniref:Predicted PurR-regulated permease PerM n=1 Tax=Clostridium cavendishii DSM 21758 TaxID=1121302 RepID=A0A1M6UQU3_9CLOT|nr:AI-2E family transporter [Clostridium cavendishii]SHK71612.1 Predicted PurR-regulated permease PerM [Clostridium cavendishii DSM 21758]